MEEKIHNITMEERRKICISACSEVQSFNKDEVILLLDNTGICVKGSQLKVEEVSKQTGDVVITGERIDSVTYSDNCKTRGEGFFGRMFK